MRFEVRFSMDNASFEDGKDSPASILEAIAHKLGATAYEEQEAGVQPRTIRDTNGNRIGSWEISE